MLKLFSVAIKSYLAIGVQLKCQFSFIRPVFLVNRRVPCFVESRVLINQCLCSTAAQINVLGVEENKSAKKADISDFPSLLKNGEILHNIAQIIEEYNDYLTSGKPVPEQLNLDIMQELLKLESKSQRRKYLAYLFKKGRMKWNKKIKNEQKQKLATEILQNTDRTKPVSKHIEYTVGKTALFMHIHRSIYKRWYNLKQARSILFGQNIVLDLDYEEHMTRKEVRNSIAQIVLTFGVNRTSRDPFNLHICNAKKQSFSVECLEERFPYLSEPDCFINVTDSSYLDLFPKENLVYLSPHATETLKHFDPAAVYIIGAFVDISRQCKVSHLKAENDGIKSYSLPLDEYILWGIGTKSLSINQVFEVMLTLRDSNDWKKAFECIPKRKIKRLNAENFSAKELPDKLFLYNFSKSNKT